MRDGSDADAPASKLIASSQSRFALDISLCVVACAAIETAARAARGPPTRTDRRRAPTRRTSAVPTRLERKEELRRIILAGPITHLSEVGRDAARERHELGTTFRFRPNAASFLAFRTAAGSMAGEAETHREVLIKHGLAEPVLQQLVQLLDQFDEAVALGNDGRTAHVGATRELKVVASEIAQTVRVLDGRNRQRFQEDGQLLGSWISASTVLGTPRGTPDTPAAPEEEAPPAGAVRPAA